MLRACHRTTPAARIFAVVTAVVALYTMVTAEVDCISFADGGLGRDCRLLVDGAPPSVVIMAAGFLATVMAIQLCASFPLCSSDSELVAGASSMC